MVKTGVMLQLATQSHVVSEVSEGSVDELRRSVVTPLIASRSGFSRTKLLTNFVLLFKLYVSLCEWASLFCRNPR
jgi:hypothetical protein